jgi:hypothetical protein
MIPKRTWYVAAALLAASLASLSSQGAARAPAPLFAADEAIEITLALPLRTLVDERARLPAVKGTLTVAGSDAAAIPLDVEVRPRGRQRLANCTFPPLRLDFKRGQVADTLFAGQNRLKLVTPCRSGPSYEDYLELEYLVYRMYEQLGGVAFRVRRAEMRYVDVEHDNEILEAPAFLIEPLGGVAARFDLTDVESPRIPLSELDARALTTLALFQFVIGNTDWAATRATAGEDCCHNADVLAPRDGRGSFVLVPYDFDHAGIIDADYATPSEGLGLTSVRQRRYRGFCRTNEHLDEAILALNMARPEIEALLKSERLSQRSRTDALRYLDRSYEILNDTEERQREIVDRCREG